MHLEVSLTLLWQVCSNWVLSEVSIRLSNMFLNQGKIDKSRYNYNHSHLEWISHYLTNCMFCVGLYNYYMLYLELTIDPPPPPRGDFSGLWFSNTLWYVAFRKNDCKILVLRTYRPLKYVTTSTISIFCIFNTKHPCIKLFK